MRSASRAVVVCLALVLAGCTGEEEPTAAPPASAPADDATCAWGEAKPGETVPITLEHDGSNRTYEVHLPADYDCTPRPVAIGLHGYYGNGAEFESKTMQASERIDELGYIGLFPDGAAMGTEGWKADVTGFNDIDSHDSTGPDGPTCTKRPGPKHLPPYDYGVYPGTAQQEKNDACNWGNSNADDEGFLRAMIAEVESDYAVDPGRIFMTGMSQGGQTTHSLAWRLSDVLAAVAPSNGFSANGYAKAPTTPMSLFQIWSDDDKWVDGHERPSADGMIYEGADETVRIWAQAQGCDMTPVPYRTEFDGFYEWTAVEYPNCDTGAKVVTAVWTGCGHCWGRRDGTAFATDSIFAFFGQVPSKEAAMTASASP